jgi:hypothetical protein
VIVLTSLASGCQPAAVSPDTSSETPGIVQSQTIIAVATARKIVVLPTNLERHTPAMSSLTSIEPQYWVTLFTVDRMIIGGEPPGVRIPDETGDNALYILTCNPCYREDVQYIIDITMAVPPAVYVVSEFVRHLPALEWSAEREEAIRWHEAYHRWPTR